MRKVLAVGIAVFGVTVSVMIAKNAMDIHHLRKSWDQFIREWEQAEVDEEFAEIVDEHLSDLDE